MKNPFRKKTATQKKLKSFIKNELKTSRDYTRVGYTGIAADETGHARIFKGLLTKKKK